MAVKVVQEWLNSCSGCEISIVDMGERLLDVLQLVEFVHSPVLMDHKYFGQLGNGKHMEIPEATVGIVSGGVRNEEHLEVLRQVREKCQVVVALGTCATHGGIPALCNSYSNQETLQRYYGTESTDPPEAFPDQGVPALLDACYALDEKVKIDVYLPGCPPHPDQIFAALVALVEGKALDLPGRSVCDHCPTVREGKGQVKQLRRFLQAPYQQSPDEPLSKMRCILEQGMLCMGPVTRAGCGGNAITPRCLTARVPCRGCYGPVKQDGNQRLDMLNALASNGIDLGSLPETVSLLRFAGGHHLLRPTRRS
ncbi:MAG TPA: methyl viologen-reducing hydrogenase [Syntrophobacter fumaroxidans]|nr:methyl viologen-reducing hydrogenase [Syntrophobacter fumaroxidans]